MVEVLDRIYFEGEVTEIEIAALIKQIDAAAGISRRQKSKLRLTVIELCSNVITHHSGTAYGEVLIDVKEGYCDLEVSNFVSKNDCFIIEKTLDGLRKKEDVEAHYYEQLAGNTDSNKSAKLGLTRVFKLCGGNLEIQKTMVASKIHLTFKLIINDND